MQRNLISYDMILHCGCVHNLILLRSNHIVSMRNDLRSDTYIDIGGAMHETIYFRVLRA